MDTKTYEIVLSPDLPLTPPEFVANWNATAESHLYAEARFAQSQGHHYDPSLVVAVLLPVATGTTGNALADLSSIMLEKRGVHQHTPIEQVEQADGTERFIVDIDE